MSLLGAALVLTAAQAAPTPIEMPRFTFGEPTAEEMELGRSIALRNPNTTLWAFYLEEAHRILKTNAALSLTEQVQFGTLARRQAEAFWLRAIEAEARTYAEHLSVEDLRAIAAFEETPAADARRRAMAHVAKATDATAERANFSETLRNAFCAETGKLCL